MKKKGLENWLPDSPDQFSGPARDQVNVNGIIIKADIYVSDWEYVPLFDRLFSFPWQPLTKYKYTPTAYFLPDGSVLVSFQTLQKILKDLHGQGS